MKGITHIERLALAGENGRYWYTHAASEIESASELLGCDGDRLADLLAVFSPRVSVRRSIRFTIHYITTRGRYLKDCMGTVRASVEHYARTGEIRGPKTSPFASALKGDSSAIVLDVWMARAFNVDHKEWNKRDVRRLAKSRIRTVARRLGWRPAEVQAAVWTAIVRESGRTPPQFTLVESTLWGTALLK